ncbi:MAG: adenylyltransferase/cytidyltransferase family protein [Planctomycetes bacterium]|nr:adenylyltransferase/cytidyltransferase family protein [Planctomycetota bacterium]
MKTDVYRKIRGLSQLAPFAEQCRADGRVIVHCHGCFDIVHPGHLRYLQFARQQGDVLVVSLTGDDAIEKSDGTRPYVPQEYRAESLAALEFVDHVVIVDGPTAEPVIEALRPGVYIKGKEYEESHHPGFLAEKALVEQHGGRVIFSSGDVVFSSTAIVQQMGDALAAEGFDSTAKLGVCCERWGIDHTFLRRTIGEGFRGKRVAVVGDTILDVYTFCEAGNIAGEAPIMSVRPIEEKRYLGGAAIVASHLRAMGALPHLFTTAGDDADSRDLIAQLDLQGIAHTVLATRRDLPTKLRYLVESQKLLKVDRGTAQPLDSSSERQLLTAITDQCNELDAVIFLDFGYGTLTASLLAQLLPVLRPKVRVITGDVSGPRRTLLAMHGADLLTPNERELRSVVGDFDGSLPTVAVGLMKELRVANLAVTMGARGCVLFRPREENPAAWFTSRLRSEYLPTLAPHAVDPLGAGDAFLSAATLSLTCGASLTQAGYLGSAAAAIAVGRLGNQAINAADLQMFLRHRPELSRASQAVAG